VYTQPYVCMRLNVRGSVSLTRCLWMICSVLQQQRATSCRGQVQALLGSYKTLEPPRQLDRCQPGAQDVTLHQFPYAKRLSISSHFSSSSKEHLLTAPTLGERGLWEKHAFCVQFKAGMLSVQDSDMLKKLEIISQLHYLKRQGFFLERKSLLFPTRTYGRG